MPAAGAILASSDSTALEKRHHSPLLQEKRSMAKACGHGSCLRISQAVTGEGTIWTCGGGDQGQLGHGDEQDRLRPMGLGLEAFGGLSVVLVTCCCWHHLQGCRSDVSLF